jgi:Flp pilus assembly protein TadD
MGGENCCLGCGNVLPNGALDGLCPVCLFREGLADDGSAVETGPFMRETSNALATLDKSLGGLPMMLLRDSAMEAGAGPLVQPGSTEMPPVKNRTGRLQLLGEIARGGMGAVLKGRDPDLGRDLAVKVLLDAHRDKPDLVRRFIEEAQIGGQLQHPGIVPIYELGAFADHRPYFAMKLVKGRTLASLLDKRDESTHDLPRFLSIFESVCQTMAYAHARGVIHRDLKPSNIMVGSFGEVQVMDWGLAKVLPQGGVADDVSAGKTRERETVIAIARSVYSDSDLSKAGSVMGTPSYMSPEQARGEIDRVDERCDVFALGSILCELLTGEPAFTGRSSGEIQRKASRGALKEAIGRLDSCHGDDELIALAKDCLGAEVEDRPRHAGEIARRVNAYRSGVQERLRQVEISAAEDRARADEATKRASVERDRLRLTIALAVSIIGLISFGVGGWVYLGQLRAAARSATERIVSEALDEVALLRGKAKGAPVGDLSKWPEALVAARQARSLLAALEREQLDAAHNAAELAKDTKFLERLEKIRLEHFEKGNKWVPIETDTAYLAAFREFGVDVDKLDPAESGRRLRERSSPLELAFFLDDWTQVRYQAEASSGDVKTKDESWRKLIAINHKTDPDPWRTKLRGLVGGKDHDAVKRVAEDENGLAAQPERSSLLLSQMLEAHDAKELAEKILKRAWSRRPDDFWICSELARISAQEGVRFASIAVALRPKNAWAHSALAGIVLTMNDQIRPGLWSADDEFTWINLYKVAENTDACLAGIKELQFDLTKMNLASQLNTVVFCAYGNDRVAYEEVITTVPYSLEIDDEVPRAYKNAIRLRPEEASLHLDLATILFHKAGASEEAIVEYRKAMLLSGGKVGSRLILASHLVLTDRMEEAVSEVRDLLGESTSADDHTFLGSILQKRGETRAAFNEFRRAFLLKDDSLSLRVLAGFLRMTGTPKEEIAVFRERIRLHPDDPVAHKRLGDCLLAFGEVDSAVVEFREALRQDPKGPYYLDGLGCARLANGEVKEALAAHREAHGIRGNQADLGVRTHLRHAERLAALEARLDKILRGQGVPTEEEGTLDVAELCRVTERFAVSAQYYREAFKGKRSLADDLSDQHLLYAAIAAAQAGTNQKPDPDVVEPMRWRAQALEWLRAERDACANIIEPTAPGQAKQKPAVTIDAPRLALARRTLDILIHHRDLACVRDEASLKKLTPDEQKAWEAFWADVSLLLKKADSP